MLAPFPPGSEIDVAKLLICLLASYLPVHRRQNANLNYTHIFQDYLLDDNCQRVFFRRFTLLLASSYILEFSENELNLYNESIQIVLFFQSFLHRKNLGWILFYGGQTHFRNHLLIQTLMINVINFTKHDEIRPTVIIKMTYTQNKTYILWSYLLHFLLQQYFCYLQYKKVI